MSITRGCLTFSDFFQKHYGAVAKEPFASRFKEESERGSREGMIKVLMNVSGHRNVKIAESFWDKDDVKAAELYEKAHEILKKSEGNEEEERKACNILAEALFATSASSRLFLDALLHCARISFKWKAFVKCLRYCECMLGLPVSLYDKTTEMMHHCTLCKNECAELERECRKQLKVMSLKKKKKKKTKSQGNTYEGAQSIEGNFHPTGTNVAIPVVDGKGHQFLENCSDAVTLQFNEKKGRHLVANRNIKAGSVLIVDHPFCFSTDEGALTRNCLHCHSSLKFDETVKIPCRYCQRVSFCSENCRKEAWETYHQYECPILDIFYGDDSQRRRRASHLLLAYRTTVLEAMSVNKNERDSKEENFSGQFFDEDFLQYHTEANCNKIDKNDSSEGDIRRKYNNLGFSETYRSADYRTVLQMETHCADMEPGTNLVNAIDALFLAKCFMLMLSRMDIICSTETVLPLAVAMFHHIQAINCNAYEIVENVRDETSHVFEPRYIGGAIYPTVSLLNHSCYPNIVRHSYPSGVVVVKAIRFIGKGSEILDCYGPQFLNEGRLPRREYLWKKYRFLCACEACTQNWQFPLPEVLKYKCTTCSSTFDASLTNQSDTCKIYAKHCPKCRKQIDGKKLESQFKKSVEKRKEAISKMYDNHYEEALPLLIEHIHFIEKFFAVPNNETIKTQQCIIQCYNHFGCTSR